MWNSPFSEYFIVSILIEKLRDTIPMKKLTSRSIIREGIREFSRSAFSTPSISRRNSLEITTRQSSSDEQKHNNQPTITSLVRKFQHFFWTLTVCRIPTHWKYPTHSRAQGRTGRKRGVETLTPSPSMFHHRRRLPRIRNFIQVFWENSGMENRKMSLVT